MTDDVHLSKRLAYTLRHNPAAAGVHLDDAGWVDVDDLLAGLADTSITRTDLERVVAGSDKQRFELAGNRIRARQGHSVPVDLDLPPASPPTYLFHGTPRRSLPAILEQGLRKGDRHHVHLSPDVATATAVGRRRGNAVVLRVDAAAMVDAGFTFFVTGNGVWLTETVPPQYLTALP